LCIGIVSYITSDGKSHNGLASSYLACMSPSQILFGKVRPISYMHLPFTPVPIICICGGTGIAPFLGFLEHRELDRKHNKHGPSKDLLFFGCRGEYDVIFKERLNQWKDNSILGGLNIALSREEGKPKQYVQHLIQEKKDEVKDILMGGGYLYICGSSAMANDVTKVLVSVVGEESYKNLLEKNYIVLDVWG